MMIVIPHYDESILEITIDGEITKEDIKKCEEQFNEMKTKNNQVSMLLVIERMNFSLSGLIEDLKVEMKYWNEFDKIAVVSDKKSFEMVAKLSNVLPKMDIKHFTLSKIVDAMNWLKV